MKVTDEMVGAALDILAGREWRDIYSDAEIRSYRDVAREMLEAALSASPAAALSEAVRSYFRASLFHDPSIPLAMRPAIEKLCAALAAWDAAQGGEG